MNSTPPSLVVNETKTKTELPQMPTIPPESQLIPSSSHEMILRIQNSIEGQLAILVEENDAEMIAVPLNLYNKSGKVILSIERTRGKAEIWGTKFGHWAVPDPNVMISAEYPLGFGVLVSANKLFVSKHFYTNKKSLNVKNRVVFLVRNQFGDLVFGGKDRVNMTARYPLGRAKQIDFKLYDPFKREVIFCRQLLRFSSCLSSCCLQRMEVMAQPSKSVGIVHQKWTLIGVEFVVEDQKQKQLFRVKSTQSGIRFKYKEYTILSMDNKEIGRIRPSLTDDKLIPSKEVPILSIEFNETLNAIQKTLLISALFLIKSLFYDK